MDKVTPSGQQPGQVTLEPGHAHFADGTHEGDSSTGQPHGFGPAVHNRHVQMGEAIADCQALLCGGIGAWLGVASMPVVTDLASIDEAVMAYVEGHIVDHTDQLR
jgi:hypothetical protein